ncbi:MAG: helix-turn-helix domain-containing protein [Thermoanaerobacter sp.]|nr:helix-turn-helix domain-containing protein [Thermoanaerobacter sp.]
MQCPKCQAEAPEGSRFCPACGKRLPIPKPELKPEQDYLRGLPPVLEPKDVAKLLNIGLNRLYEHLQQGDIPARRIGRRWRISTKRLFEWLDGVAG